MTKKRKTFGLRLRTRSGASIQKRWANIMLQVHEPHKCPNCAAPTVEREAAGIWQCRKCGYKFAGGAYVPSTKPGQASRRIGTTA